MIVFKIVYLHIPNISTIRIYDYEHWNYITINYTTLLYLLIISYYLLLINYLCHIIIVRYIILICMLCI